MKIIPKEVTKRVTLLTDPEPGWMALVTHGANQTPWNVIKADSKEATDVSKGKGATQDSVITRLHFSKDVFKTEEAVQKFIDDKGFADVELIDEGDIFVAKSTILDNYKDRIGEVKTNTTSTPGVTAKIALLLPVASQSSKADMQPSADGGNAGKLYDDNGQEVDANGNPISGNSIVDTTDQGLAGNSPHPANKGLLGTNKAGTQVKVVNGVKVTTAKGDATDVVLKFPESMKKYDFWGAMMSNEGSLMGVLKNGMDYDNLPPGLDEVMSAMYVSAGNVLGSSDDTAAKATKVNQIGEDFATITMGLYEMFSKATDDATKSANTDRRAKAAAFVTSFSASVTRAAKGEFPTFGDNVTTAKQGVTIDVVAEQERRDRENGVEPNAEDAATKALRELFGKLESKIDTGLNGLGERLAEVETTTKSVADRSTQRRSLSEIDVNEIVGDNDDDDNKPPVNERLEEIRRSMGGRPRSGG